MRESTSLAEPRSGPLAWYGRVMRLFAGTSMIVLVVVMVVQVVARYVFNASLIWAEELCRYILVWQTFVLIGLAYSRGEFVSVDIVTDLLKPRARYALKLVTAVPVVAFLALLTAYGYLFAGRFAHQTVPAFDFIWTSITGHEAGLTVWWIYVSVPIGCALLILHIVGSLVAEGRALFGPAHRLPDTPHHWTT